MQRKQIRMYIANEKIKSNQVSENIRSQPNHLQLSGLEYQALVGQCH